MEERVIKTLYRTVTFIRNHPLTRLSGGGIKRFFRFQLGARLLPYDIAVPFVGHTRLLIRKGMTGATGNYYCGLHEFEDMAFLLHLLRDTDRFADVGANVGSYTILASGVCGATTWCFEPCLSTFQRLCENIRLNDVSVSVHAINMAVGSNRGTVTFTQKNDTTNHIVPAGSQGTGSPVAMDTLDVQLRNNPPHLLKIDVEGYETEVIKGASTILSDETCKAVIMEVGGGSRYGYDEQALHRSLLRLGFSPYTYDAFKRKLLAGVEGNSQNNLYIRDKAWSCNAYAVPPYARLIA